MKTLNKVQLVGWLGGDPKIYTNKDGSVIAKLKLATDIFVPQKDGPPRQFTSWHTVVVWRTQIIERLKNYIIKGSHILVEGRLNYNIYQDKSGHTRYTTQVIANFLVDLDR